MKRLVYSLVSLLLVLQSCSKDETSKAVDLGLSVKWASCNIGAASPEDFGGFYSWGEVEKKGDYSHDTYRWYDSETGLYTKYNTVERFGTVDDLKQLQSSDDAASVIWGDKWRMPTLEEAKELIDKCTWQWGKRNGVVGYIVKSKVNKKSIFIPAGGRMSGQNHYNNNGYEEHYRLGYYWTSSLNEKEPQSGKVLVFDFLGGPSENSAGRIFGLLIRPVCR